MKRRFAEEQGKNYLILWEANRKGGIIPGQKLYTREMLFLFNFQNLQILFVSFSYKNVF